MTMRCRKARRNLSLSIDEGPSSAGTARLQRYLEHCSACRATRDAWLSVGAGLRESLHRAPDLSARVLAELDASPNRTIVASVPSDALTTYGQETTMAPAIPFTEELSETVETVPPPRPRLTSTSSSRE